MGAVAVPVLGQILVNVGTVGPEQPRERKLCILAAVCQSPLTTEGCAANRSVVVWGLLSRILPLVITNGIQEPKFLG